MIQERVYNECVYVSHVSRACSIKESSLFVLRISRDLKATRT